MCRYDHFSSTLILHLFDAFLVEEFVKTSKKLFTFQYDFIISVKLLFLGHFFETRKQVIVAGGQIWGVRQVQKQLET